MIDNIASNLVGEDGASIDRIYESISGKLELINSDMSVYKGKIFRKTVIKTDMQGNNFRAPAFLTEDGRWFDRGGLPSTKPKVADEEIKDEDNGTEDSKNTEEGIETSSKTQDEESLQGSNETDTVVASVEKK